MQNYCKLQCNVTVVCYKRIANVYCTHRVQYVQTRRGLTSFRPAIVLSRSRALSLQSLSITQAVQTSVISKTNGGMSVASFEPPPALLPPLPPGGGGWSALEDNLLNKSSPAGIRALMKFIWSNLCCTRAMGFPWRLQLKDITLFEMKMSCVYETKNLATHAFCY